MSRRFFATTALVLLLGSAGSVAAADDVPATIAQTEAEKREVRERRQAYQDVIHHAAPGVDWREIERENRHAAFLTRQADMAAGRGTTAWTELGSANQAGRTHVTAYSHQSGAVYIGSALGGVWKGDIDGTSWAPISDGLGIGGHRLTVSRGTPEVITVSSGLAMYVSANDGATWDVPTGLPDVVADIVRILDDPASPNRVFALIKGRVWTGTAFEFHHFVMRSDNGGLDYVVANNTFDYNTVSDMWVDRVDGSDMFVASGSDVYRSTDGGDTFTLQGTIPTSLSDIVITASEAGAPTVYAAVNTGSGWQMWRSATAGSTWTLQSGMNAWWGSSFCASITNPNLVLYAGVECWRSINGGVSATKVNNWYDYYGNPEIYLHADFPGRIECRMIGGQETFFLNTDGGTYTSTDGALSVLNISLNGLGVSQYYTVFTSQTDPYLVVAGAQDQGYQQSDPSTSPYLEFDQLISGDYAQATSTVRDHNWLYTVYPGFILVQQNETAPQQLVQRNFPAGTNHLWLPPIHADPVDDEVVYLGAEHLWKYQHHAGGAWTETQLPHDFSAVSGGTISAIGIAPSDASVRYVAMSNSGLMWNSHDGGDTWTSTVLTTPGHYFHGHGLTISPVDPMHAFVSGAGYSGPAVYETSDGGVTWTARGDGLPSTMVYEVAFDNPTDLNLYAATEAGAFRYSSVSESWTSILGSEAPLTAYWDVESVPELGVMRFGTYGRGIWDFAGGDVVAVPNVTVGPGLVATVSPSPARSSATVSFALDSAGLVSVEVFDLSGRRVLVPVKGELAAGPHNVAIGLETSTGRKLEAGMYFVRVTSPNAATVEKLQVVR